MLQDQFGSLTGSIVTRTEATSAGLQRLQAGTRVPRAADSVKWTITSIGYERLATHTSSVGRKKTRAVQIAFSNGVGAHGQSRSHQPMPPGRTALPLSSRPKWRGLQCSLPASPAKGKTADPSLRSE